MADIFELVGRMSIDGVDKAARDINGVTDTAQKSSGIFGSASGKIAGAVAGAFATTKIIGFGKDVLSTTQTFSDAMLKVQSLSGASGDELQKLNDTALKYGSTTAWTASQVADAMGYMALAGFDTNEIMDSLGGTLSLASASGTDLGRASDILTDSLTAFGYKAKDAGLFANVLATTQAKSNTTVEMLGEAFKYVAPLAGTYKYEVESVSTALGMMANAGIKGSMAGTSMASIITRLATDTNKARTTIEELGIAFYNEDGTARDLSLVLTELADATANMTAEEKANIASKVAGQEAQKGLLAILNQGSEAYKELEATLRSCGDSADEMAGTMESGMGGAIRAMQSAIEGFKIKLGQRFEPYVTKVLQDLASFVSGKLIPALDGVFVAFDAIEKIVRTLSPWIEILTASFIAFKAGAMIQSVVQGFQSAQVALALFRMETQGATIAQGILNGELTLGQTIVGLLTGKVTLAELATGLWAKAQAGLNLVLSMNPIALVVMAIGSLIAILVVAYKHSETFRNAVDGLWGKLKEFGNNIVSFFATFPQKLDELKEKGIKVAKEFVDKAIEFFKNLPTNLWKILVETVNNVVKFGNNLNQKAKDVANSFKNSLINGLKNLPSNMLTIGSNLVKGLWNGITGAGNWLKNQIRNFSNSIINTFKNGFKINSPSKIMRDVIGHGIVEGIGVGIEEDDSAEKSIMDKVDDIVGIANNSGTIRVGASIGDFVGDSPMQKYQLDFNAKIDSLNDGFERLIGLVGQYLPNIANGMDRNIVIDGSSLAVGMSRKMDSQLGKIAISKGRGNV